MFIKTYRDRGFTLVELMIALGVVGLLAGIAIPIMIAQTNNAARNVAIQDGSAASIAAAMLANEYTDLGDAPASNQTAFTYNVASRTLTMTLVSGSEPASPLTSSVSLNLSDGSSISSSGLSGTRWCITITNSGQNAVYTDDGFAESATGCTAAGRAANNGVFVDPGGVLDASYAPTAITTNSSGTAAPYTNNRVTWTAGATCPSGNGYQVALVEKDGTIGSYATSDTLTTTTFNLPAAWFSDQISASNRTQTYGLSIRTVCSLPDGTTAATQWSAIHRYSPAAITPPTLSSTTPFASLTWNAATSCPAAFPARYQIVQTRYEGNTLGAPYETTGWLSGTSYTIPTAWQSEGAQFGYTIAVRCQNDAATTFSYTSTQSTERTHATPISPPVAGEVVGVAVDDGGTGAFSYDRVEWLAAQCADSKTSPSYSVVLTTHLGAAVGSVSGLTATSYDISSWVANGAAYGVTVNATCVRGANTSNPVSSGVAFANDPASAIAPFVSMSTANAIGLPNTWSGIITTCASGMTPQYKFIVYYSGGANAGVDIDETPWQTSFLYTFNHALFDQFTAYEIVQYLRCVSDVGAIASPGTAATPPRQIITRSLAAVGTALTSTSVRFSWDAAQGAVSTYDTTYRVNGDTAIDTVGLTTTSQTITGLPAGAIVIFQVRARTSVSGSNQASAYSPPRMVTAPFSLTASPITSFTSNTNSGYTSSTYGVSRSVTATCPSSTTPRMRLVYTPRNGTATATAWVTDTASPTVTETLTIRVPLGHGSTVSIQHQVGCLHMINGAVSSNWYSGTASVTRQASPAPSVSISLVAWHQVSWSNSCSSWYGTISRRDDVRIYYAAAAWLVKPPGTGWWYGGAADNSDSGSYYQPATDGWGSGSNRLYIEARCYQTINSTTTRSYSPTASMWNGY